MELTHDQKNYNLQKDRYIVAITGASGAIYAERLISYLIKQDKKIICLISPTGLKILKQELEWDMDNTDPKHMTQNLKDLFSANNDQLICYHYNDMMADIASGSSPFSAMIIVPCSMGSLARIAHGSSGNLIERTADVCIKEKRPFILVPRECPLNEIHLANMYTLSKIGATIIPPMPAFYYHPKNINDLVGYIVGKILDTLKIEHELYKKWNGA